MVMVEEEGMPADEGPTVPAGAGEAWPDRRMRETRAAEGRSAEAWSTDMGEVRTAAHAADMHAAEATRMHPAHAAATEMAATAEAAAATVTPTSTAASGEYGRSERHHCCDRRRSETFEKPVVHRSILLAVRR
jgi:hypothetical protein